MSLFKPLEVELKSQPETWGIVLDRVSGVLDSGLVVHLGVHWLIPPTDLIDPSALDYRGPEELVTLSVIVTDEALADFLDEGDDEDDGEEAEEGEEAEDGTTYESSSQAASRGQSRQGGAA